MKSWISLILALFSLAACRAGSAASADDKSKVHVGIVFDSGGKDDRSFNAAAWQGVRRAAKDLPDRAARRRAGRSDLDRAGDARFRRAGLRPGHRHRLCADAAIEAVAKDYPKINFAIVDGVSELPNVASLIFKEHEGRYLVGMIAARDIEDRRARLRRRHGHPADPQIREGLRGGRAGRSIRTIQVIQNYVGVTEAAWNNPGKGKELALAQIGKGADVIFAAAGNSGLGAFDAAEQYGKDAGRQQFVIGVDSNQNWVKPGFVLTSMVKRVDNAVYQIVNDVVSSTASRAASTSTAWRTTASATPWTSTTRS